MFVTRMRRREVGGDNARKISKLSQNCELLSERTKETEVASGSAG